MTATATAPIALGIILASESALALLAELGESPLHLLARHSDGDWGDIDAEDRTINERARADGSALIISAYQLTPADIVWIVTAPPRDGGQPETTMLLPTEY